MAGKQRIELKNRSYRDAVISSECEATAQRNATKNQQKKHGSLTDRRREKRGEENQHNTAKFCIRNPFVEVRLLPCATTTFRVDRTSMNRAHS